MAKGGDASNNGTNSPDQIGIGPQDSGFPIGGWHSSLTGAHHGSKRALVGSGEYQRQAHPYHGWGLPRSPGPPLPLASPLYATLHQLSPMMIQVRSREPFYSQVTGFSRRVRANGGTVLLDEWDGLPHLWQYFSSVFQPGREAIERIGLFIREKILSTTFSNTSTGPLERGPLFGGG